MKRNIQDQIIILLGLTLFVFGGALTFTIIEAKLSPISQTANANYFTPGFFWYGKNINSSSDNIFKNDQTQTTLTITSATSSPKSYINISSPEKGQTFKIGSVVNIKWKSDNVSSRLFIELRKGGITHSIIKDSVIDKDSYKWTIPDNIPFSNDYTIRIYDQKNKLLYGESEGNFSIVANTKNSPISGPGSRYCPKGKLFTGHIKANPSGWGDGSAWIGVEVDKKFIQDTLIAKRDVDENSIPLTPIYDLVVRIIPSFNFYCIPGYPEKSIKYSDLPETVAVKGSLRVGSQILLKGGIFTKIPNPDIDNGFFYQWKIKGWPYGIVPKEKMDILIKAIASETPDDDPVFVTEAMDVDGKSIKERSSPMFSLCVPIGGRGRTGIAYAKTLESKLSLSSLLFAADDIRTSGFGGIDPFKTYKNNFSHFLDLKTINYLMKESEIEAIMDESELNEYLKNISSKSSCRVPQTFFYVGDLKYNDGAESGPLGLTSLMSSSILLSDQARSLVAIHETGHAMSGLMDEQFLNWINNTGQMFVRNCSKAPSNDYKYNEKLYGDINIKGCAGFTGSRGDNQEIEYVFRPSQSSLMSFGSIMNKFNVVSCGYVLSSLIGGDPKVNFDECMKMDTIKPSSFIENKSFFQDDLKEKISKSQNNEIDNSPISSSSSSINEKCYVTLNLSVTKGSKWKTFKVVDATYSTEKNVRINPGISNDSYYTIETYKTGTTKPVGTYLIPTSERLDGIFVDDIKRGSFYIPTYDNLIEITVPSDGNLSKISVGKGNISKTIYTDKKVLNCGIAPQTSLLDKLWIF